MRGAAANRLPMASDFHGYPQRRYRFDDPLYEAPMKPKYEPGQERAAQLAVCARAEDLEDARRLLDMLGLLPEEATGPADDRRVLGWRKS